MSTASLRPLSGLDATFLSLETEATPMHISGISLLTPGPGFGLESLRELLASRLSVSRALTERLVSPRLGLSRPAWQESPTIDLEAHVERTQLPAPGGRKELAALVAWELGRLLPRDRPLWHLLLAEGLDSMEGVPSGSVALISRVHHAAIDGVSGSEIMASLFDTIARDSAPSPVTIERTPTRAQGALDAPSITSTLGQTARGLVASGVAWGVKRIEPPPVPFSAPTTIFNAPVTPQRSWDALSIPLQAIKEIKSEFEGATVNDVILTICSGALRSYLLEKGQLPQRPLVAMVPISVRSSAERKDMGNKVSAMLVALATDQAEPQRRLESIIDGTRRSKIYHQAIGATSLGNYSEFIPFAAAGLAARLYTRMKLAKRHRPVFNLVITNVPGPQVPLYVGNASLLSHAGAAPLFDGMGLIMPVFSYNGRISIGLTSCRDIVPDPHHLRSHLARAVDELAGQ